MLNEEKISSRMVEMANRSDGRKGLYCICSHMGWAGFLSDGGKVEIPLEGIPDISKQTALGLIGEYPGNGCKTTGFHLKKFAFPTIFQGRSC